MLQELTTIEDFQGLIAEDFYMSGKDNFPNHSELIEHRMFDELGRGLCDIKSEFARRGSVNLAHETGNYKIYFTKAVIKIDAVAWVLGQKLLLN
jgi:hypothetical protein